MAFPTIDACIVCDGVRQEVFAKHILLGFYGTAPHAQVNLQNPLAPATLCFIFCGGPGEGKFDVGIRVTDSQGSPIPNAIPDLRGGELVRGKPSTSVFMGFQGTFGREGRYRIALMVNGAEHYHTTLDIGPFVPTRSAIQ